MMFRRSVKPGLDVEEFLRLVRATRPIVKARNRAAIDEHLDDLEEAAAELVNLSESGVDTERLARAIYYARLPESYVAELPDDYPIPRDITNVDRIAAEYARLMRKVRRQW